MTIERGLRTIAILIAVLAAIDPVLSRTAPLRPRVVVQHATEGDRGLALQVADTLASSFDVSRSDDSEATAYVIVGADFPEGARPPEGAVVFAVAPGPADRRIRIMAIDAAPEVSIDSVSTMQVSLEVPGTGNREVTLAVKVDDVHRQEVLTRIAGDETRAVVPVTVVPSRVGLARVRVDASMIGGGVTSAEVAMQVTGRVWRVLVFDGRPTYASAFVRRALEADPRFDVVTRSVTSRGMATQTGGPPQSLGDANALSAFDLIVIGAPATLGAADASALEAYARDRHGAVVLLPEGTGGEVVSRLTGVHAWRDERRPQVMKIAAGELTWSASEFLWPSAWPVLATPLATGSAASEPPVWQIPLGGGRIVVNSASDGWRSRADMASGYSAFWRLIAATAAAATPSAVDVHLADRLVVPGASVAARVQTFGAAASHDPAARVIDGAGAALPARLWPDDTPGLWRGSVRAPDVPGRYRLEVTAGALTGAAEFIVDDVERLRPAGEGNGLAALAAAAHGGAVIGADVLTTLPARLHQALTPAVVPQPWHPMRAVWWLLPFTLAASAEWWLRRRRGLR